MHTGSHRVTMTNVAEHTWTCQGNNIGSPPGEMIDFNEETIAPLQLTFQGGRWRLSSSRWWYFNDAANGQLSLIENDVSGQHLSSIYFTWRMNQRRGSWHCDGHVRLERGIDNERVCPGNHHLPLFWKNAQEAGRGQSEIEEKHKNPIAKKEKKEQVNCCIRGMVNYSKTLL